MTAPPILIKPGIVEHRFQDAGAFLRFIDPAGNIWGNETDVWIFRGQSNADWPLVPNAHRPESWIPLTPPGEPPYIPSAETEQVRLGKEAAVVDAFLEALGASGLPVPFDYRAAPSFGVGNEKAIAVAQHYGLPTRLLDWTRQAAVAAYFACLRPREHAENLAVWALNATFVNSKPARDATCEIVRTTRADNPNLHAQDGLFTNVGPGNDLQSRALPTIDSVLSDLAAGRFPLREGAPKMPDPVMRKFILPRSADASLMQWLHKRRVSGGRLFPGLSGVAMAVRERLQFGVTDPEF
jgi:hypothetical protein